MGTDPPTTTRLTLPASGCEKGPTGTTKKEKELAVEEEEGGGGDEPDC